MKKQFICLLVIVLSITLFSCSKDDADIVQEPVKSNAKQITVFAFKAEINNALVTDITATVDEENKVIRVTVPYDTDITVLKPTILISEKANMGASGFTDFTSIVSYEVIAEDGTKTSYDVLVTITPNNAKQILSFQFLMDNNTIAEDITAVIEEETKTISFNTPPGTDITALTPTVQLTEGATISPEGLKDFTFPVTYGVKAEDNTSVEYSVEWVVSERDALIAIYSVNPDNTLGWDISGLNINLWQGVTLNSNGEVIGLNITDSQIAFIPHEIGELKNLRGLSMASNTITTLPASIGKLTNLTSLYLNNNAITELPEEIGNLTNLISILLDNNSFNTLPKGFGALIKITVLDLSNNRIEVLPPEFGSLNNLKILFLNDNKLFVLPPEFGQLTKLTYLDLSNNELTGLPDEFGQLSALSTLNLSRNSLDFVPEPIFQLSNLVELGLGGCPITTIPKEIAQLSNLGYLIFYQCELNAVPAELGQLTNLDFLGLGENNFTTIPQEVCDLETTGTRVSVDSGVTCN